MVKKRILVYTESFLPSIGGLENNTLLLCNTLRDLGYHVTLLTPQVNAAQDQEFKVIESRCILFFFRIILQHDEILVNGGVAFKMVVPCVMLFKNYRIIYQMATLYKNIPINKPKNRFWNMARLAFAKIAVMNIGVSEYSYHELKKTFGSNKSAQLINPADPCFESTSQELKKYEGGIFECLIAGRLIEGKGLNLLSQAIKELKNDGNNIHLHVVGDGTQKKNILKEEMEGYLSYHLPMTKTQLKEKLTQVHLTIIPSTSHIEGSPLIMAESLLSGTPVLVSSQPAMVSAIKHPELVFESLSLGDLKKKIYSLMQTKKYQEINEHCKEISSDFSYHRYVKNLEKIINS